jgi:hypothetical protein
VTSQVNSATSAIETGIPNADSIIPKNCSLGMKQFCVGFENHVDCQDLPLDISKVLPKALTSFGGDQVKDFQSLEGILARVTPGYIRNPIIWGLVVTIATAVAYICFSCAQRIGLIVQRLEPTATLVMTSVIGLVCCILFAVPTIICFHLLSKAQTLTSGIRVNKGEVGRYSLGSLICVLVTTALAVFKANSYRRAQRVRSTDA